MLIHDIKNPLDVILGYSEMLLEEVRERRAVAEERLIERLKSNVLALHSLLTNYLNVTQIEAGRLTLAERALHLNDLLRRIGQQYEAEAGRRRIALKFRLHTDLPLVQGDPLALERVFTNLVTNALKFTPERGTVTIRRTLKKKGQNYRHRGRHGVLGRWGRAARRDRWSTAADGPRGRDTG